MPPKQTGVILSEAKDLLLFLACEQSQQQVLRFAQDDTYFVQNGGAMYFLQNGGSALNTMA